MIRRLFIYVAIAMTALYTPLLYAGNRCFTDNHIQQFRTVEQFDVIQKRVEFDADYFLGQDGYYDVVEELRAKRNIQEREELYQQQRDVAEMYREMLQAIRELKGETPHVLPAPKPEPEPDVLPPAPQPIPHPDPDEATILDVKAYRIFKNKCGTCHTDAKSKGGLSLFGEGYLNNLTLDERVLIHDHTAGIDLQARGKKLMPLGGPALPDEEVELLRLWMVEEAERINKVRGH